MEQGLAGQAADMQQGPRDMQQAQQQMISVDEVAALLMQGVDPEELVRKGVPVQVIEQAIQMIMAQEQQAQAQQQPAQTPAGLAATQM